MTSREYPILFSGPMIRAILDGQKTQTRRILRPQPRRSHGWPIEQGGYWEFPWATIFDTGWVHMFDKKVSSCEPWHADDCAHESVFTEAFRRSPDGKSPYGKPGDRLWVRETWGLGGITRPGDPVSPDGEPVGYAADWGDDRDVVRRWRPSIHMPRWASRIMLEITDVRVERLQEITEEDALADGVSSAAFAGLWDEINGARAPWESNPWVWVVTFRRITP